MIKNFIKNHFFDALYISLNILLVLFTFIVVHNDTNSILGIVRFVLSNIAFGSVFLGIYIVCIFLVGYRNGSFINKEIYNVFLKYIGELILYTSALAAGFSSVVSFIIMHSKDIYMILSKYMDEASHIAPDVFYVITMLLSVFNIILFGKAINKINHENSISISWVVYLVLIVGIIVCLGTILDDGV